MGCKRLDQKFNLLQYSILKHFVLFRMKISTLPCFMFYQCVIHMQPIFLLKFQKNYKGPNSTCSSSRVLRFSRQNQHASANSRTIRNQCFFRPIVIVQVKLYANSKACYMVYPEGIQGPAVNSRSYGCFSYQDFKEYNPLLNYLVLMTENLTMLTYNSECPFTFGQFIFIDIHILLCTFS